MNGQFRFKNKLIKLLGLGVPLVATGAFVAACGEKVNNENYPKTAAFYLQFVMDELNPKGKSIFLENNNLNLNNAFSSSQGAEVELQLWFDRAEVLASERVTSLKLKGYDKNNFKKINVAFKSNAPDNIQLNIDQSTRIMHLKAVHTKAFQDRNLSFTTTLSLDNTKQEFETTFKLDQFQQISSIDMKSVLSNEDITATVFGSAKTKENGPSRILALGRDAYAGGKPDTGSLVSATYDQAKKQYINKESTGELLLAGQITNALALTSLNNDTYFAGGASWLNVGSKSGIAKLTYNSSAGNAIPYDAAPVVLTTPYAGAAFQVNDLKVIPDSTGNVAQTIVASTSQGIFVYRFNTGSNNYTLSQLNTGEDFVKVALNGAKTEAYAVSSAGKVVKVTNLASGTATSSTLNIKGLNFAATNTGWDIQVTSDGSKILISQKADQNASNGKIDTTKEGGVGLATKQGDGSYNFSPFANSSFGNSNNVQAIAMKPDGSQLYYANINESLISTEPDTYFYTLTLTRRTMDGSKMTEKSMILTHVFYNGTFTTDITANSMNYNSDFSLLGFGYAVGANRKLIDWF